MMVDFTKAVAYQQRGELQKARDIYEDLLRDLEEEPNPELVARLHNNLGAICAEIGDTRAAAAHFERTKILHRELGNRLLVEKAEWGLGRALLAAGDFSMAEPISRRLRGILVEHEMPEDAGEVALDLVEVPVALHRFDDARLLTETVISEFRAANLNDQAITAVGYLRDLLATTQQAREAVKHVRTYVQKLRTEPKRLFLAIDDR